MLALNLELGETAYSCVPVQVYHPRGAIPDWHFAGCASMIGRLCRRLGEPQVWPNISRVGLPAFLLAEKLLFTLERHPKPPYNPVTFHDCWGVAKR